jgi:hypothetical protein
VAEAGPEETAKIVATVADSLIAVGALPVTSTPLREFPGCADSDEDQGHSQIGLTMNTNAA